MPASTATAPGKVILFGEHAVVYGHPAIAAPVSKVRARAVIQPEPRRPSGWARLQAPDIGLEANLDELPGGHPLAQAVLLVFDELRVSRPPAMIIRVTSTIPVAAGLGSGTAISVALMRALSGFLGHPLPQDRISGLAYEVEKIYHETPSGIDNTVVTYSQPVYFIRGMGELDDRIELLSVAQEIHVVIGDTGISSPTSQAVGDVRRGWQAEPERYNRLFEQIGALARDARRVLENGRAEELGPLMDENHTLLCELGVSSGELDSLVAAARASGALGAKLSGGGRGGNMIALVTPETAGSVAGALLAAGAKNTILTTIRSKPMKD
jgi:mevalonate kinase